MQRISTPRATIFSASSDNDRCSALASSHGARSQRSYSSGVVRIAGIALSWIGSTIDSAPWSENRRPDGVLRSASTWCRDRREIPSRCRQRRTADGRYAARTTRRLSFSSRGLAPARIRQNCMMGTSQRCSGFSHPRQCGDEVLRMLVTGVLASRGGGMPQRIMVSSRSAHDR
jgi:hypothetical protein